MKLSTQRIFANAFGTVLFLGLAAQAGAGDARQSSASVERGRYLVTIGGCNDCHTPFHMGPDGPEPDLSRMLSGHPATLRIEEAPPAPTMPWMTTAAATNTAWAGPWGVSFTANLTPDKQTGLGSWDLATFRSAIRTGKHQGKGRPILPPMPWPMYRNLTDEDFEALFAYLQSIPAISNRVPGRRACSSGSTSAQKRVTACWFG